MRRRKETEGSETVRRDKRDPETERVGDGHDALSLWISITASNRGGICLLRSFPTSSLSYFSPPSSAWLSLTKDMFKVDFALQGSNRKLQPENHKPKADRAETPWLRNISALETPHTFPLESLITAWASRSSCQCCCHGNMVCTRERESERQQPPPTPFVWNLHYRCVVLGCLGATQLRICVCHQTSGMNTTSGSWRDSVSCDTFIIFVADVTSPLPSCFFCIFPTIFFAIIECEMTSV